MKRTPDSQYSSLLFLFALSGFVCLVYEVLWFRELRLLFGDTAQAAATTLTAFFLGMAWGASFWGRRAERTGSALRLFAVLQLLTAASAALYFPLLHFYESLYVNLFSALGTGGWRVVSVKFALSTGLLFLPAFFMGGMFPVIGRNVVRAGNELGSTGSLFYGVNTLGAAAGALVAGFFLPRYLGYRNSYLLGMCLNVGIGVVAFVMGRCCSHGPVGRSGVVPGPDVARGAPHSGVATTFARGLALSAFASGLFVLALEVLWTRMFMQVLKSSVYAFAAILCLLLLALSVGAGLARVLCRRDRAVAGTLSFLLAGAGIAVLLGIPLFPVFAGGPAASAGRGIGVYVFSILKTGALTLIVPGILCGSVLPFLLKAMEDGTGQVGPKIGRLISVNTVGAIAGSLAAGFVLLPVLGLWWSLRVVGVGYVILAAVWLQRGRTYVLLLVGVVALGLSFAKGVRPAISSVATEAERIIEEWDGSSATVTVVKRGEHTAIKANNQYIMGGTASVAYEQRQAHLPLMLHPAPDSVYFLGMGTGITAGASLFHPVKKVVVTELVPEIATAARKYFGDHTNGLFDDDRVSVVVCDGRNYLLSRPDEHFDVIIGDLFFPEKAGNLFTREHFATIKSRLKPGGLFAQWVPLYQLSRREFDILAATLLDVFDQVTLWRGDFSPDSPAVALIAHLEEGPLPVEAVRRNVRRLVGPSSDGAGSAGAVPFIYYAGNLSVVREQFSSAPINTDDRPLIEYLAPESALKGPGSGIRWLISLELSAFYDGLLTAAPLESDAFLAAAGEEEKRAVMAGLSYYKSFAYRAAGMEREAMEAQRRYEELLGAMKPE